MKPLLLNMKPGLSTQYQCVTLVLIQIIPTLIRVDPLYLLTGPILLYLCTSLLVPEPEGGKFDLGKHYRVIRRSYFTTMGLFWAWGLLFWPIIAGVFPPTAPFFLVNLVIAWMLRSMENKRLHAALTIATYVVLLVFIGVYAMQFGAVGTEIFRG